MYNVVYEAPDGDRVYNMVPCDLATAQKTAIKFTERYVGKPFPNGRGWYPYKNVRVMLAK